jgi:putative spermidine/putrescine transport system permease protein
MLIDAGIVDGPVRFLYNPAGVMVGMTNAYVPIAVLVMVSVMRSIDGRLPVVAATLGAGTAQGFWRIYFPLSMPGVAAALLLIFISSLGTFITPALLGSGREVMIAQVIIDQVDQVLNWGFAGAISLLLLVTTLLVYGLFHVLFGASSLTGQQASPRPSPLRDLTGRIGRTVVNALGTASDAIERRLAALWPRRLGRAGSLSPLSRILAGLVLLFLLAPILLIVPISFTGSNFIDWPPRNWSLRWYQLVLTSEQWTGPALRSFVVAIASAVLSVAIGLPAAMALSSARLRARAAILALILAPMIVPHILIAVALFFAFAKVGLVGTTAGLVLGHTVLCLPYVVVTLMAVFATYDQRLDQAADTLGASTWQRLWRVTIPLIRPGILAGLLIAFVTSFEELTVSMFLSGGLSATLPKQLWTEMLMAVSPALAAITCLMLAVVVVLTAAIFVFRRDGASGASSAWRAH